MSLVYLHSYFCKRINKKILRKQSVWNANFNSGGNCYNAKAKHRITDFKILDWNVDNLCFRRPQVKFVPDFSRNNMIHLNDELHDNSLAIGLEAVFLFECLPVTRCHSHHIAIRACVLLHFCNCLITEYPHLVTLSLCCLLYNQSRIW